MRLRPEFPSLSRSGDWFASLVPLAVLSLATFLAGCSPLSASRYDSDASAEAIPGLLQIEVRGATAQNRSLVAGLGELLDEQVVEEDDSDLFLPREKYAETIFLVKTALGPAQVAAELKRLRALPEVLFAEPVFRVRAFAWSPDDPAYAKQWHLRAAGAAEAWGAARGAGVTVAVIDTGIAPVDDLDAGRIVAGHNFLRGAKPGDATDDHGHGTHVAGTIAQSTNNGRGTAGMAPLARLLPLKVLGADGGGTSAGISDAIRYAADHGAQVLNLSLGGGARSEAMARAVAYARRKGCFVAAAAGNGGGRGVSFPAAYDGAFAVSAVGPKGRIAPYSSFGPEVALAAPGGDKAQGEESGVLQQTLGDDGKPAYLWFQGTSMATPHVAGAAALLYSAGVTNPAAVERLLQTAAATPASDAGAGSNGKPAELFGSGLLDAGAAVRTATLEWGTLRLLAALGLALLARAHARHLGQVRRGREAGTLFWGALLVGSGGLAALAWFGAARLPLLGIFAVPPPLWPARWIGLPGANPLATLVGWIAWSALPPFLLATIARGLGRTRSDGAKAFAQLAAGLAFGWAGLLTVAALTRSVHLPWMPSLVVPLWLAAGALVSLGAGRALLAREAQK